MASLDLTRAFADSRMQEEYVEEGEYDEKNLRRVFRSAAHMHYLHEHTNGEYKRRFNHLKNAWLAPGADSDDDGYYPGIYTDAAMAVQSEMPLPERLPWLQNQGNRSIDQLLTEAVEVARRVFV